jgi:hypothetical protein
MGDWLEFRRLCEIRACPLFRRNRNIGLQVYSGEALLQPHRRKSRIRNVVMRALATVALALAAQCLAQQAPTSGAVEGSVINTATGAGIPGASVTLTAPRAPRYEATSDSAGRFKIVGIAPGAYRASANKDGFAQPQVNLALSLNSPLRIEASSDPVKLDFKLAPLVIVSGRVLDPDGKPLRGATVALIPNLLGDSTTDTEGRFQFEDVRPGAYAILAGPPETAKPLETKDGTRTAMARTYYPSVTDQTLAQSVAIGSGGPSYFEIRLQTSLVQRIRGVVVGEDGKPMKNVELTLLPNRLNSKDVVGLSLRSGGRSLFAIGPRYLFVSSTEPNVISGADGRFEFGAVPPGDWWINAAVELNPGGATRQAGLTELMLGREDINVLEIRVAQPFKLNGAISLDEKDASAPNADVLRTIPFTFVNADTKVMVREGIPQSGKISIENFLPGLYKVFPEPGYSMRFFLGESEVTNQAFSITAASPPFRAVLSRWAGAIQGTVEKGEGSTVVLMPQRTDEFGIGQTILCGPGGSFQLSDVSPGEYFIAAFDRVEGMPPSSAVLSLTPLRGKSIKVSDSGVANVTLDVIAAPR